MAIKIRCGQCNQKYELDNAMGGKSLACSCGATLEVPVRGNGGGEAAPAASAGNKSCPGCGAVVLADNVICVQCGHNFSTGAKVAAVQEIDQEIAADELAESAFQRFFPLIKLAVIVLVVLAAAGAIYVFAKTKHHGINAKNPLGAFVKLDGFLREIKLEKGKDPEPAPKGFGAEAKIYRYNDRELKDKSRGMLYEDVSMAIDASGVVCAVGASFSSPSDAIPGGGTRIQRFMASYWEDVGCPWPPDFKEFIRRDQFSSWTECIAEFKDDNLTAKWIKTLTPSGLQASSDQVWIIRKGLSLEALENKGLGKDGNGGDSKLQKLLNSKAAKDED